MNWRQEVPDEYFHQSASIHIIYHYIRVLIHRPFIPTPSSQQVLNFPSAVVCMSAARSCLSVVQAMKSRGYIYNLNLVVRSPRLNIDCKTDCHREWLKHLPWCCYLGHGKMFVLNSAPRRTRISSLFIPFLTCCQRLREGE